MSENENDPKAGPFRAWLANAVRKRAKDLEPMIRASDEEGTAYISSGVNWGIEPIREAAIMLDALAWYLEHEGHGN